MASTRSRGHTIPQIETNVIEPLKKRATLFAAAISRRSRPTGLSMKLKPRTARLCWTTVLVFHLVNGFYALGLACVYRFMMRPDMDYHVKLLQLLPQKNYRRIIALYACVSGANFYSALMMLVCTTYYRQVAYGKIRTPAVVASEEAPPRAKSNTGRLSGARAHLESWLPKRLRRALRFLKGFFVALSVRGQLFDAALLVREIVEVASQAYQAKSSSCLVSTVWINQLYSVLLFLNCIANTAVYVFKKDETGMRRFLCTAIDPEETRAEPKSKHKASYLAIAAHAIMPLSGVLILLTSLHAGGISRIHEVCGSRCKLQVHPWLSTHCACSVLEINCHRDAIEGTSLEMQRVFETLDAKVLDALVATHWMAENPGKKSFFLCARPNQYTADGVFPLALKDELRQL